MKNDELTIVPDSQESEKQQNTPKTFKIGDKTYLSNDFLALHGEQQEHFMNLLRDKYGFTTDESVHEMNKLMSELSDNIRKGKNYSADGYFIRDDDSIDNSIHNVKTKGINKYANARVAMQKYLLILQKYMKEYQAPSDETQWDVSKHGFQTHLTNNGYNAKELFENYDKTHSDDYSMPRSFSERNQILLNNLANYYKDLKSKTFTDPDKKYEKYTNSIENLLNQIATYDSNTGQYTINSDFKDNYKLSDELRTLGLTDDYINAFTSDQYRGDKTNEELQKEYLADQEIKNQNQLQQQVLQLQHQQALDQINDAQEARRIAEEEKEKARIKQEHDNSYNSVVAKINESLYNDYTSHDNNPLYSKINSFDMGEYDDFDKWLEHQINDNRNFKRTYANKYISVKDSEKWSNAYNQLINSLQDPDKYVYDVNSTGIDLGLLLGRFTNKFQDRVIKIDDNNFILKDSINKQNGTGVIYDKKSGQLKRVYLGNASFNGNTEVETELRNIINSIMRSNKNYEQDIKDLPESYFTNQIPNILSSKKGGSLVYKYQDGGTPFVNKYNWTSFYDFSNPPKKKIKYTDDIQKEEKARVVGDEWTGNDITKLITIGTDLSTMFIPGKASAIVGAVSSTADFINEWNRDGLQWSDVGNYALNLGMDVVGAVPFLGDALATTNKIKKGLISLGPKLLALIGTTAGIVNSPQIYNSFTKIFDDRDMTVQDWQNVAQGVGLLVAGAKSARHAVNKHRVNKVLKTTDDVIVAVNSDTGKQEFVNVSGTTGKKIKEASNNKNLDKVNELIQNIPGMEKYSAVENEPLIKYKPQWFRKDGSFRSPIAKRPGTAYILPNPDNVINVYTKNKIFNVDKNQLLKHSKRIYGNIIDKKNTYTKSQLEELETLQELNNYSSYAKKLKSDNNKIKKASDKIIQLESQLKNIKSTYPDIESRVEGLSLKELKEFDKYKKYYNDNNPELRKSAIEWMNNNNKFSFTDNYDIELSWLKTLDALNNQRKISVKSITDLPSYKKFKKIVDNTDYSDLSFDYKFDFDELLKNYKILKTGGTIDKNKLNKFLNYGKR